jgi:hypothetical protein
MRAPDRRSHRRDGAVESIQAILGAVALVIVAVAVILAVIILVLIEARWILRLWVDLYRRWKASIRQLQNDDAQDPASVRRHGG